MNLSAADAAAGIVARADGARSFVRLVLVSGGARLQEVRGSTVTTLGSAELTTTGWHTLKLTVSGGQVTAYRDAVAFAETRRACELVGWEYRLVGVPEPVAVRNVRWLAGYRHPRYRLPGQVTALRRMDSVSWPA